jgi:hypothetical protein
MKHGALMESGARWPGAVDYGAAALFLRVLGGVARRRLLSAEFENASQPMGPVIDRRGAVARKTGLDQP